MDVGISHTVVSICAAGAFVGVLYGVFGVGSAFATPLLALIGVGGMAAVAGPLPALLPGSATGAWSYSRDGHVDWPVARRVIAGAFPAAIAGAVTSQWVGGPALIATSGVVLLAIGLRVLRPGRSVTTERPWAERHPELLTVAAVGVGFASGLLANGGGFLLVPLFLLAVGLDMRRATGTSLVVATALTVPTVVTYSIIGSIDWAVSFVFAAGLVPGAWLGASIARRLPTDRLRPAFGALLVGFAVWFLAREVPSLIG